jgi:YesN/AraC family two-component response regulator
MNEPRKRVLLVDDEPDVRRLLRLSIANNCDAVDVVDEAANGQEAVDKTRDIQPDVVVMDLRMPVMDGVEAIRQIKNSTPGVDVIVYSAAWENEKDALDAGASEQFMKGDLKGLFRYLCPEVA